MPNLTVATGEVKRLPATESWRTLWRPKQEPKPHKERVHSQSALRFQADLSDPRHGTHNGYVNLGCRCQRCRDANSEYQKEYELKHPRRERHGPGKR